MNDVVSYVEGVPDPSSRLLKSDLQSRSGYSLAHCHESSRICPTLFVSHFGD